MNGAVHNRVVFFDQEGWPGEIAYLLVSSRNSAHPPKAHEHKGLQLSQEELGPVSPLLRCPSTFVAHMVTRSGTMLFVHSGLDRLESKSVQDSQGCVSSGSKRQGSGEFW